MFVLFTKLLNMCMSASILALAVIVLRILLRKVPQKYICILWLFVAVRLICPINISSIFSVYNLMSYETVNSDQNEYFQYVGESVKPQISYSVPDLVKNDLDSESMTVGTKTKFLYMPPLMYIWLFGFVFMIVYAGINFFILRKKIAASIRKEKNIYVCENISSPFIFGIIGARIFLPSGLDEITQKYVIAHELAHLKRHDQWWKLIGYLLLSVYWFNPILWISYILFCRDIETACDEKVIRNMDKKSVAEYSEALLTCAVKRRMTIVYPLAFGENNVKGRVKNVLNYRKPALGMACIAILICLVVAVCFLTGPKKSAIKTEEIAENVDKINTDDKVQLATEMSYVPTKEEVISMREKVLEGMSEDEIARLTENIKVANLQMESAYLNENLFEKLSDKDSPYWLYFDRTGEIQLGWWYNQSICSMESIMRWENITEEEFYETYTEPGIVYNRFDADSFINLVKDMQLSVHNEALILDLQRLIDLTQLAKDTHEMVYANEIYMILHDMDYFLLRYGIEDVGLFTRDDGFISTYYGVLEVYKLSKSN